jgi:lipopolysaccharide assembly outer membrane protein LptD (OstA)
MPAREEYFGVPYIYFPIDDRQSGFLPPSIGIKRCWPDLRAPYCFNWRQTMTPLTPT